MTIWTVLRPTPIGLHRVHGTSLFRIEAELNRLAVPFYAPSETKWIRHRKTQEWIERRQSLMPYVFLAGDDVNWLRIERECRDTFGPVRKASGAPITIPDREIARLKEAQEQIDTAHALVHRNRELTKRRLGELYPAGSKLIITSGPFATQQAVVLEATGRQTVKAMIALLGGQVAAELSIDDVQEAAQ